MPQYVKVGGTWRQVDETANCGYIKVGGTWRTVTDSYVKVAGTWRNVCAPVVTTTTTTTTTAAPTTTTTTTTTTTAAPVATISNLAYTATGSTTGTLSWSGSNISAYLFTGSATNYPSPYNYGTYTGSWPGNLVNMVNGQSYTVTITVSPGSNSQTITFTHTTPTTATTTTTTTTTAAPVIPSFTSNPTVTNISNSGGTLSWASVNQASYTISAPGTALDGASGYTATQRLFTGLSAGTTYSYQVIITSSTGHQSIAPAPAGSFTTTGGTTTTTTTAATTTTTTAAPTTTTTTTAAPCTVGGPCGSGYTCYPEGFYTYYSYNAACNCIYSDGFC